MLKLTESSSLSSWATSGIIGTIGIIRSPIRTWRRALRPAARLVVARPGAVLYVGRPAGRHVAGRAAVVGHVVDRHSGPHRHPVAHVDRRDERFRVGPVNVSSLNRGRRHLVWEIGRQSFLCFCAAACQQRPAAASSVQQHVLCVLEYG